MPRVVRRILFTCALAATFAPLLLFPHSARPHSAPLKVAVCFYGLTRSLKYTVPLIHKNVFGPLRRHGVAYSAFLHTFTLSSAFTNPRSKEFNVTLDADEWRLLAGELRGHEREDQAAFDASVDWPAYLLQGGDYANDGFASVKNLVRQYHSLSRCIGMVERAAAQLAAPRLRAASAAGGYFDAVLFLRPDLLYLEPIDMPALARSAASLQPAVVVPSWGWDWEAGGLGYNDRFAYANAQAAYSLARRGSLDNMRAYLAETSRPWSDRGAEPLLGWTIDNVLRARVIFTDVAAPRMRSNGALVDECARSKLSAAVYGRKGMCGLDAKAVERFVREPNS